MLAINQQIKKRTKVAVVGTTSTLSNCRTEQSLIYFEVN